MNKGTKYALIIILIAIVALAIYVGYEENEIGNNVPVYSENTVQNNTTNVINNEIIENNVEQNNTEETNSTEDIVKSKTLTDEEKAKELVKQEWGETDGVYFSIDNINSDETYIVSVRDSSTTRVLGWYKVDIKTGEVTVN